MFFYGVLSRRPRPGFGSSGRNEAVFRCKSSHSFGRLCVVENATNTLFSTRDIEKVSSNKSPKGIRDSKPSPQPFAVTVVTEQMVMVMLFANINDSW